MRMRAVTPSVERCTKRSVSRDSCPKAFTTRRAPSVSCTTASAELSSFLTCRDWRRMRGRYRRDSMNSGGDTPRGTRANCQARRRGTNVIMAGGAAGGADEIGRGAGRGRGEISGVGGSFKKKKKQKSGSRHVLREVDKQEVVNEQSDGQGEWHVERAGESRRTKM